MSQEPWFAVLRPLSGRRRAALWVLSFSLPLLLWSAVSYLPFLWHPVVRVTTPGDVDWFSPGLLVDRHEFARESARVGAAGGHVPAGERANPIFLPAPHQVARALYTAFTTKPVLKGEAWLHESLWLSIQTIFWGFVISSAIGVPLGVLCGAYAAMARLTEPLVDFVRYMPAPAFGALMVAIFGIYQQPKVAIVFIGTFFQQVLVVANTVRKVDPALLEAAQTLGAKRRHLIWRVIVPASLPDLYNDLRILLGWAWTYLIVAEVVGISSGITFFINQQAKYRNFDNVYAAILIIGFIGLVTDLILGFVGQHLFGWRSGRARLWQRFFGAKTVAGVSL
ncbi:MAG TPA: ABC transporter permease subunit [Lacunisphaera sp.]|nr:ABC transporter permease subunit [Lacunisphaera sp.]